MPKAHPESRTYRALGFFLRPLLSSMVVKDWQGQENIPATGGLVVAANHVTQFDPLTFAHYLYDTGRAPKIMAKHSLWDVPVVGRVLRNTGMIPVRRGSSEALASLTLAAEQLEAGECVAVFPEGTVTKDPEMWPMVGKTGVARLALTSRTPVVPVAQFGAHQILAPYSNKFRPWPRKKVSVHAGPPVVLDDLYDRPQDGPTLKEATARIMRAITELEAGIRGVPAPPAPYDPRSRPTTEDS
ncbi:1-acyl-sn-glycerol-3-phosphate acyltransferase [Sediminihabitans luteus]|uniref:1-acyl-sn-glycerol-3-phosphate acyltransferase n=1 Tax=Sediminihabitans luteus TaxID=1138585 RepID=A0A2M9CPH1_9CELL|nr:lysophospholipid acyltransferase family protein [Sediminihabitans luteus]PJJ73801.1 1-acyl-sn-glycerol-3-phosphate acyltransferase [Sediminihabitans luteus]GIJ00477.1 1-acyl-sn-glycerol-3-phosphate acyltransferase [Sediminihabitans luteus]